MRKHFFLSCGWGLILGHVFSLFVVACEGPPQAPDVPPPPPPPGEALPIKINELMALNHGAWVNEEGQTSDWLELYNTGNHPLSLKGLSLGTASQRPYPLPDLPLAPRETILLWA
jgi:hypothetical protein